MLQFLKTLVETYPTWTTRYYVDALKIHEIKVRDYLLQLGYVCNTDEVWSKNSG